MEKWTARSIFTWHTGGGAVTGFAFAVECPELVESEPGLNEQGLRRLMTLRLVCAETARYAVPPREVRIWLDGDDSEPALTRARWRSGIGFCHGSFIMKVAAPLDGAQLTDLREIRGSDAR